jgi:hypothetical protein
VPVLEITDEDGQLHLFAPSEVLAAMLYPGDERRRNEFRAWGLAYNILALEDEEKRKEMLKLFAELLIPALFQLPDPDTYRKKTIKYAGSSWVAGEMLMFMLSAAVHHSEYQGGPTPAVYTLTRTLEGSRTFGGQTAATKKRTLWKAWGRFKRAAHLIAARQITLQGHQELTPELSAVMMGTLFMPELPAFLAVAEGLRQLGERHRILNPGKTWRTPDNLALPAAQIEIPPLPASALEVLATYRPEYADDLPAE